MRLFLALALLAVAALPAEARPLALRLHEAVEAVAPIDGVSIGDPKDKKTWRADFKPTATEDQKYAAKKVIKEFDADAPDEVEGAKQEAATRLENALGSDDQAEVISALKEALKAGVIRFEK